MVPPELVDLILAHACNESDGTHVTLHACTYVSRIWRNLAYPYLFKKIRLTIRLDESGIENQTEHVGRYTPARSAAETICFLISSPHITNCVRFIYLQPSPRLHPLPVEALRDILHHFCRLQHITLENVLLGPLPEPFPLPLLASIDSLHISMEALFDYAQRWTTQRELIGLLRLFGEVRHLHLAYIPVSGEAADWEPAGIPPVHAITVTEPLPLNRLLQSLECLPLQSLHTLQFDRIGIRSMETLASFLRLVGSALRHLSLGEFFTDSGHSVEEEVTAFRQLDLQACINLESVSYRMIVVTTDEKDGEQQDGRLWHLSKNSEIVVDSISRVLPPWTQRITLSLCGGSKVSQDYLALAHSMSWTALEDVLMRRIEGSLRSVVVENRWPFTGNELERALVRTRFFPRLEEKGVLSVRQ